MPKIILVGKIILIGILAVLYAIGLSIAGVKYAIIIAVLAAVFSLIPYFGNIIGFVLAAALAIVSGGGLTSLAGVAITFTVAQFAESYILQPLVVGQKVNLNPFFTIIAVIAGNLIWGITGAVIAIPYLAIVNIIFDNIKPFRPVSWLISDKSDDDDDDEPGTEEKIKDWIKGIFGKK